MGRKLYSDLMFAARTRTNFDQAVLQVVRQNRIIEPRSLRAGTVGMGCMHPPMALIFAEEMFQVGGGRFDLAIHNRPIHFFYFALAKGGRQTGGSLRGAGDDHNPGDRRVEPTDNAKVDIARLVVLFADIFFRQIEQTGSVGADSHGGEACRFVDHQQMVVLVEYLAGSRKFGSAAMGSAMRRLLNCRWHVVPG